MVGRVGLWQSESVWVPRKTWTGGSGDWLAALRGERVRGQEQEGSKMVYGRRWVGG
jgi:hypothetical protein